MKRGRKSSAELAVKTTFTPERPVAPEGLTPEQLDVWCDVTLRLPPDWFPKETHALLTEYCRAVTRAEFVGRKIDAFKPQWLGQDGGVELLGKLVATTDRQVRLMMSLARALRITNQSRLKAESAARKAAESGAGLIPPWIV